MQRRSEGDRRDRLLGGDGEGYTRGNSPSFLGQLYDKIKGELFDED